MNIETRALSELKAAEYNPRKDLKPEDLEYKKIKRSIEEFGYVDPIIINADGTIIGGHQRAKVLQDLGYTEVEVIVLDVDKAKEKGLNIALNKITGEWDQEKLKDLLNDLGDMDFDMELTGFDSVEIKHILNEDSKTLENTSEEIDLDDFGDEKFEHTCPKCGFKY